MKQNKRKARAAKNLEHHKNKENKKTNSNDAANRHTFIN